MLFRTSASVIALVACTSLAAAADLEGPSYGGSLKDGYAAQVYNWSGLYFGGHVGYGWATTDVTSIGRDEDGNIVINYNVDGGPNAGPYDDAPLVATNSYDGDGWLGGLQLGYNIQAGPWVIGVEGDYSWSDVSGSFVYDPTPGKVGKVAGGDVEWLASLRARLGYATDRVLVYGTAGVAFAEFGGYTSNLWDDERIERASTSSTETGWVAGGGLEVALTQNISLRGEYLYYRFDDASGSMTHPDWIYLNEQQVTLYTDSSIEIQTFRVGVNYKFGG
jgi:outer membrane immunogenic protein